MKKQNRAVPVSHHLDFSFNKGNLVVDGEKYQPMVDLPTLKEVMLAKPKVQEEFQASKAHPGPIKSKSSSSFRAYVAEVESFEDIKRVYCKIRDDHLGASHIPCGYRLFGKDFPFKQDFSDDGEYGAGHVILEQLQNQGIFNTAVYVVRYYDGAHIGPT